MPLVWNTESVKYFSENPDELWVTYNKGTSDEYSDVNPETKSLIFGTMSIGINSIKYSTAPDFYARWKILEKYVHHYLYHIYQNGEFEYVYLSPDILRKHMGLSTNASSRSLSEWLEAMCEQFHTENIDSNLSTMKKEYKSFKEEFEKLVVL